MNGNGTTAPDRETLLFGPNLSIAGLIGHDILVSLLDGIRALPPGKPLVLEVTTDGGDADIARRIACEIRAFLSRPGAQGYVIGKTYVYSAGITILGAFPQSCRFLTRDTVLLIHERRLQSTVELNGPIRSCLQIVREQLALLETADALEKEGFEQFVAGSDMGAEDLFDHAVNNCYMRAAEALERRLVADLL